MNFDVAEYASYIYPFLLAAMTIEFLYAKHVYHLKETLASFSIAIGATIINVFSKVVVLGIFVFFFELFEPVRAMLGYTTLGFAWYIWILCQIADDFNFYWHYRFCHHVRLLWAAHIPHHSAETFNFTVSIRNGWFVTFFKPIYWLWMPIIGFEPIMVATCLIINSFYQYFLHTQFVPKLKGIDLIFNTPWAHVVHHSSNLEYLDKNHGGILIIWDKLFGTYQPKIEGVKSEYGVLKPPKDYSPITAHLHEFENIWKDVKKVDNWKDKLKYIFYPPGWSHDNSTQTAAELQKDMKAGKLDVSKMRNV